MNQVPEITVADYVVMRAQADAPVLLDVREPDEIATASLEGAVCIPLGQIPARMGELPNDQQIVVMCHHGRRSAQAAQYLLQHGFDDAVSLAGGIDAWSVEIDPSVPRY